jgi:hypothetical protein
MDVMFDWFLLAEAAKVVDARKDRPQQACGTRPSLIERLFLPDLTEVVRSAGRPQSGRPNR